MDDTEWLRREYVQSVRTGKELASEVGVSEAAFKRALIRQGITPRANGEAIRLRSTQIRAHIADEAPELYANGMSLTALAARFEVHQGTVASELRARGVELRSRAEAHALRRKRASRTVISARLRKALDGSPECVVCGASIGIEWHHLDGDRSNNAVENLAALCGEHHTMIEWFIGKARRGN